MHLTSLSVHSIYHYSLSLIVTDYLCINVSLLKPIKASRAKQSLLWTLTGMVALSIQGEYTLTLGEKLEFCQLPSWYHSSDEFPKEFLCWHRSWQNLGRLSRCEIDCQWSYSTFLQGTKRIVIYVSHSLFLASCMHYSKWISCRNWEADSDF